MSATGRRGADPQLTFEVKPHPDVRRRDDDGEPTWIIGSLKLAGAMRVHRNLDAGERLLVRVADEDGAILCSGYFELGLPGFKPITQKGTHIGTERVHTAKLDEDA